ncbi:MAG: rlmN [Firmicutes bacterium]|nr:rlmN [Bacillota bacterium]
MAVIKTDLCGMFADEIAAVVASYGLERYRGRQIAEWIYRRGAADFGVMTSLPKDKRELLNRHFGIGAVKVQAEQHAADGSTSKFLLALSDGLAVETVLMRHRYGNSVCVSTQVGCGMGCIFCASTINGVIRNLTGGEILSQVLYINQFLRQFDAAVDSVVIMGSGEPLANYDNVLRFIKLCHQEYCLNMSYRSFTLSTAGLVPGIDRLASEGLPVTLAISLHAPNNVERSRLMPINEKYPLEELLAAADRYASVTGRRVTYEYTLISEINDFDRHARQLVGLMKRRLANVNLIPVNPVSESGLLRPDKVKVDRFLEILHNGGINATVRREMGTDIRAACGQLRHKVISDSRN